MKAKNFIQNYKLEKALGEYSPDMGFGDKVHMFNCLYKVCNSKADGYTILEDEAKAKFAIPTKKLALLMKKGIAKNVGAVNMLKAIGDGTTSIKMFGKPKSEPVGTVHQGKNGRYRKVSDNPAKWVHVGEGTSHDKPDTAAHRPLSNPKEMEGYKKVSRDIYSKAHPEDREKLMNKLLDYVKHEQAHKNLSQAHGMNDKGESASPDAEGHAAIEAAGKKALESRAAFITALKASVAKRKEK